MRTVEVKVTLTVTESSFQDIVIRLVAAITRRFRMQAIHADFFADDRAFARFTVVTDESRDFDVVSDLDSLESVIMKASLHAATKVELTHA